MSEQRQEYEQRVLDVVAWAEGRRTEAPPMLKLGRSRPRRRRRQPVKRAA